MKPPDQKRDGSSAACWPPGTRARQQLTSASAPPWLVAPSRRRRIGEADVGWDSEALAVLTELREQADAQGWPGHSSALLPADVAAAIADDRAIVADEDHLALERAWYEAELTAHDHHSSPQRPAHPSSVTKAGRKP